MKKQLLFILALSGSMTVFGQHAQVLSPDSNLKVEVNIRSGAPFYSVTYKDKTILEDSPLGFVANTGDFSRSLTWVGEKTDKVERSFVQDRIKQSYIKYRANQLTVTLQNANKQPFDVIFSVSDNDIAFRYAIPKSGETGSIVIEEEKTGFDFPSVTTTFLTPQSDAMIGWKRTKPSYEEWYKADAAMSERSQYGHGYTFPGLFRIGNDGWALVSETGVDSRYCASHLSDASADGLYTIAFPMKEENNGNGTVSPGMALPAKTPWRTITVGDNLKPIVETTIPWSVVDPLYETEHEYKYGRGTWSWILWQDKSINYEDQVKYIDFAAAMGYEYLLVDNWWDKNIGHDRMEQLVRYARSRGVNVFLWYSSSGYWNDITQSPVNCMDNSIIRKREMRWLEKIGVKGIKVDFFGGDKQETMRLYESIVSDADDHGLMVIFHGCTLPRGWERMYPNYVGSEAVLASENLIFEQKFCDYEAFNSTLHPFIRNAVGCMEFGGSFLNKRLNKKNDGGSIRRTTDVFSLATAVLFQNPIQNFALAPNNLDDAPAVAIDFMKQVPTTWDEVRFIDGYPGKYCVLARRHGSTWYVAGINAEDKALTLELDLPMFKTGDEVTVYEDGKQGEPVRKSLHIANPAKVKVSMPTNGGVVIKK